jgi:pimeloyl-ACP methyl ester carboxylesterase/membrane protein DedA with SNARE-associated domain
MARRAKQPGNWFDRFRRGLLPFYLILMAASYLYRSLAPPGPFPPVIGSAGPERSFAELPIMEGNGSATGNLRRVAYVDQGSGEALILIHGSPGSAGDFHRMIPELAKSYRVIAPDMPGFGLTGGYARDYGPVEGARLILALMERLGIDRAHLLGYSYGAAVAESAYAISPNRFRSMILYGGIGIQEGEGSGDYHIEHLKYALGFPTLLLFPELLPHFGLLGEFSMRYAFLRNFWDLDQRPFREILKSIRIPVLIVHGIDDSLVPADTAREHHRIIPGSELVMLPYGHIMPFVEDQARILTAEVLAFLDGLKGDRPDGRKRAGNSATRDLPDRHRALPIPLDPSLFDAPWRVMSGIILATFVSEDLTLISVGILIGDGRLDPFTGLIASFAGIFLGDAALWIAGTLLALLVPILPRVRSLPESGRIRALGEWLEQNSGKTILISRFVPGTRTITYLAAGFLRIRPRSFLLWALLAGALWTPLLIALAALSGPVVSRPIVAVMGANPLSAIAVWIAVLCIVQRVSLLLSREGRYRTIASLQRIYRWEFWPPYLFYIPVGLYVAWKSIRHRSFTIFTAVNPSIPDGGVVGESKFEILTKIPADSSLPSALLHHTSEEPRHEILRREIQSGRFAYPLILKPDRSQRGASVRLIQNDGDARRYLENAPYDAIAQGYHPGPIEVGILYYRFPDEERGSIFSVTEKLFPYVHGDGRSTLRELIFRHARYRMQAATFLRRHASNLHRIPADGEAVRLAVAGNHCQGTLFRDGKRFVTEPLTNSVDRIARSIDGFHMGRFDIRCGSVENLMAGQGLFVIEVNGALGESTNIYDPDERIWSGYATLFRQIDILYEIGSHNVRRGAEATPFLRLARNVIQYYRHRRMDTLSD